jgi:hypothetical protein
MVIRPVIGFMWWGVWYNVGQVMMELCSVGYVMGDIWWWSCVVVVLCSRTVCCVEVELCGRVW